MDVSHRFDIRGGVDDACVIICDLHYRGRGMGKRGMSGSVRISHVVLVIL